MVLLHTCFKYLVCPTNTNTRSVFLLLLKLLIIIIVKRGVQRTTSENAFSEFARTVSTSKETACLPGHVYSLVAYHPTPLSLPTFELVFDECDPQ